MVSKYHRHFRVYINATSTPPRKNRTGTHKAASAGNGGHSQLRELPDPG
jgi:hypothetical protein